MLYRLLTLCSLAGRRSICLLLPLAILINGAVHAEDFDDEAPQVIAALEQGQAAEQGVGIKKNLPLALALYCDAGRMGSPEGFFRIGRILATAPPSLHNPRLANAYLALSASLGHREALDYYDEKIGGEMLGEECGNFGTIMETDTATETSAAVEAERFDIDGYIAALPLKKREIAELIRRNAPHFDIDVRIALAVALTESNLNSNATSPKNAQGVMQLIPDTQKRFGVKKPFDPESNIRGGLAYLKWLKARFSGNWTLVTAAYNAGEGTVERHGGIPPFRETQQYVRHVLYFAGLPLRIQSKTP